MATIKRSRRKTKTRTWRTTGGDVLTESTIEALAAEAEAGYDLSQARVEHVGRPSLGRGVSPRVSFRASSQLFKQLRARAAREGRSVSDLAREALEQYVKHNAG
jgi:predicted HicB family RNase H-like nuclease